MKSRLLKVLVVAYLITWVGGWHAYHREMSALANRLYKSVEAHNAQLAEWDRLNGGLKTPPIELLPGGPKGVVNWCRPLLPGILLADSYYVIGPIYGKGSNKIILNYGIGCIVLWETGGWIS